MKAKLELTLENYKWIAKQIGCDPEIVIAVSKVECKRDPFDSDGFPAILYGKHVFYRNLPLSLRKEYAEKYPSICGSRGYGKGKYGSFDDQRVRFSKAFALNKDAAMEGCSWGPFQELGENWEGLGFNNVGEFVDTIKNGLYGACVIFIKSIKMRGLVTAMRTHKYALIARKYNGAGYKEFSYDDKIEDEHNIQLKKKINWDTVDSKPPAQKRTPVWIGDMAIKEIDLAPEKKEDKPEEISGNLSLPESVDHATETTLKETKQTIDGVVTEQATAKNEQLITMPAEVVNPEPYNKIGFWATIKADIFKALGINAGAEGLSTVVDAASQTAEKTQSLPSVLLDKLVYLIAIATVGYFIFRAIHYLIDRWQKNQRTKLEAEINSNITRKDIDWIDEQIIPKKEVQTSRITTITGA